VEGTDLARLIADEGPLDTERVLALLEQAASALDAAHERGLVHRDVKPSNMLIARSAGREHCYLADFGLTKRTGSISGLTATHQVVGTLDYVAPEQIRGGETDPRADVYSLACVLYECLASSPPFERATDVAVLWAHVNEEPPPLSSVRPDLPKALDGVLARGLAKEPGDRYDTCGELVAAARGVLAPEPVAAPRLGRRGVVALAALVVGAALAVAAFLAFGGEPGGITIEPNSVAVIDPASNKVVKGIHVGVGPDAVAAGQNSVWVANTEDETISRIDARTRELVRGAIALEGHPTDVAAGVGGSAWVALGTTASVSRVSADDVAGRPIPALGEGVACGSPAGSVAVGGGFVWYACETDLGQVDPRTGSGVAIGYEAGLLESASPVPPAYTDVAFDFGRVWLVNSSANSVVEIDTSRVVREITIGRRPVAIATGEGALWVACFGDDAVWRIDIPGPGRPVTPTRIPVGDGPSAVAVGEGGVWVVNRSEGTVSRVDPELNEVAETITIGNVPRGVAAGGGAVWVTVGASGDS
jgi:DNA-binding beta-propeller fold protein YncE